MRFQSTRKCLVFRIKLRYIYVKEKVGEIGEEDVVRMMIIGEVFF
jgi:hypothetical protein